MTVTLCTVLGLAVLVALVFVVRAIITRGIATGDVRRLSREEMQRVGASRWGVKHLSRAQWEALNHPERQHSR